MKTIHKIILGAVAVASFALVTPAQAYVHGKYYNHHGRYGYYYRHTFYAYNAGPRPYYYGPFSPPGPVIVAPAPTVVIAPRRHRFFFWF